MPQGQGRDPGQPAYRRLPQAPRRPAGAPCGRQPAVAGQVGARRRSARTARPPRPAGAVAEAAGAQGGAARLPDAAALHPERAAAPGPVARDASDGRGGAAEVRRRHADHLRDPHLAPGRSEADGDDDARQRGRSRPQARGRRLPDRTADEQRPVRPLRSPELPDCGRRRRGHRQLDQRGGGEDRQGRHGAAVEELRLRGAHAHASAGRSERRPRLDRHRRHADGEHRDRRHGPALRPGPTAVHGHPPRASRHARRQHRSRPQRGRHHPHHRRGHRRPLGTGSGRHRASPTTSTRSSPSRPPPRSPGSRAARRAGRTRGPGASMCRSAQRR